MAKFHGVFDRAPKNPVNMTPDNRVEEAELLMDQNEQNDKRLCELAGKPVFTNKENRWAVVRACRRD